MKEEILRVATAGHRGEKKEREEREVKYERQRTNTDDISEQKRRQATLSLNLKKRMMKLDI